jgi:hypothetical protein
MSSVKSQVQQVGCLAIGYVQHRQLLLSPQKEVILGGLSVWIATYWTPTHPFSIIDFPYEGQTYLKNRLLLYFFVKKMSLQSSDFLCYAIATYAENH